MGVPFVALADLTVSQKILLASRRLEEAGHTPFTAEALVVGAWQEDRKTFGLRGFTEEHPDSNRVLACVMGERGLARRGWLVKVGQKLYSLSRQGREEVERILAGDDSPLPKRRSLMQIKMPKDLEQQLVGLFTTTAFRRHEEGMKGQITYKDACRFWSLAETAHGEAVDATLARVPAVLAGVRQLLIGDAVELSNAQSVNEKDLDALGRVHAWMVEQFARNLAQQRARAVRY